MTCACWWSTTPATPVPPSSPRCKRAGIMVRRSPLPQPPLAPRSYTDPTRSTRCPFSHLLPQAHPSRLTRLPNSRRGSGAANLACIQPRERPRYALTGDITPIGLFRATRAPPRRHRMATSSLQSCAERRRRFTRRPVFAASGSSWMSRPMVARLVRPGVPPERKSGVGCGFRSVEHAGLRERIGDAQGVFSHVPHRPHGAPQQSPYPAPAHGVS